jgi:hypothetical protein
MQSRLGAKFAEKQGFPGFCKKPEIESVYFGVTFEAGVLLCPKMTTEQAYFLAANHPCTDPLGVLYRKDGRILRAIYPERTAYVRELFESGVIKSLLEHQFLGPQWLVDQEGINYQCVVESEPAPFQVPPGMYTATSLYRAAELWIELSLALNAHGLHLSDAHYGNFQMWDASIPRWVDLGSIQPRPEPPQNLQAILQNVANELFAPLQLLQQCPQKEHLVRWVVEHASSSGPMHAEGMEPFSPAELIKAEGIQPWQPPQNAPWERALNEAMQFLKALEPSTGVNARSIVGLSPEHSAWIEKWLEENSADSIIAMGAPNGFLANGALMPVTKLCVVEPEKARLETAFKQASTIEPGRHHICALGHPINRSFFKIQLKGDWVLAFDALERWDHHSPIWWENLLISLHAMAQTGLILAWHPSMEQIPPNELTARLELLYGQVEVSPLARGGMVIVANQRR